MCFDYAMSDDYLRVKRPKRNDEKYQKYVEALVNCGEFTRETPCKMEADNPQTPLQVHKICLTLATAEDDLDITKVKEKLAFALSVCDEALFDTDRQGNILIDIAFLDIYTENGTA